MLGLSGQGHLQDLPAAGQAHEAGARDVLLRPLRHGAQDIHRGAEVLQQEGPCQAQKRGGS